VLLDRVAVAAAGGGLVLQLLLLLRELRLQPPDVGLRGLVVGRLGDELGAAQAGARARELAAVADPPDVLGVGPPLDVLGKQEQLFDVAERDELCAAGKTADIVGFLLKP